MAEMVLGEVWFYLDVSKNSGTPKSSMLIGFFIMTIHFGVPLFLETPICILSLPTFKFPKFRLRNTRAAPFFSLFLLWIQLVGRQKVSQWMRKAYQEYFDILCNASIRYNQSIYLYLYIHIYKTNMIHCVYIYIHVCVLLNNHVETQGKD